MSNAEIEQDHAIELDEKILADFAWRRVCETQAGDHVFFPDGEDLHKRVGTYRHVIWQAGRTCVGRKVDGGYKLWMTN